jgi:hypothetical protein
MIADKKGHIRLFGWHIDGGAKRAEILLPFAQVLHNGLMSLPSDATPPADLDSDDFVAPEPHLRIPARRGCEQLILLAKRGSGPVALSDKLVHHGDGKRFTRISAQGEVEEMDQGLAAEHFQTGRLWAGPVPRTIWPAPVPPVAVVIDAPFERADPKTGGGLVASMCEDGDETHLIAKRIIAAPAVIVPSLRATVDPEMLARAAVLRSRALCKWLLERTRGDVFHPAFERIERRRGAGGQAYIVFGGRARDWQALATLSGGRA